MGKRKFAVRARGMTKKRSASRTCGARRVKRIAAASVTASEAAARRKRGSSGERTTGI
jgi:hypothetical protein